MLTATLSPFPRTALVCAWCVALAGLLAPTAQAVISSVDIVPANPTDVDPVSVHVYGWFADSCWSVDTYECTAGGGALAIDIHAYDEWMPGYVCLMVIIPYGITCEFGVLPAGDYVLTVTEDHSSLRDPFPNVVVVEFDVTDFTPVEPLTWGRIKGLYQPGA